MTTIPTPLGETFQPSLDGERLGAQYLAVCALMSDGAARTLEQIKAATGAPEASASARLRDMRRHGWTIERNRQERGLHVYRAIRSEA